jgi:3-oxoadipate enol-lactonase
VPTLVLVGEEDVADIRAVASRLAARIPAARSATIAAAAHMPNLERPTEFDGLVLDFLAGVLR